MDGVSTTSTRAGTPALVLAFGPMAQWSIWAVGLFIWGTLIFKPDLGLHLLWNVLVPGARLAGCRALRLAQPLPAGQHVARPTPPWRVAW